MTKKLEPYQHMIRDDKTYCAKCHCEFTSKPIKAYGLIVGYEEILCKECREEKYHKDMDVLRESLKDSWKTH